jgi:hypothetical protein
MQTLSRRLQRKPESADEGSTMPVQQEFELTWETKQELRDVYLRVMDERQANKEKAENKGKKKEAHDD